MANFAPTVNARGSIYAHKGGIVLRSTYFVFLLYTRLMGDTVIDSWMPENEVDFEVEHRGERLNVPAIDMIATKVSATGRVSVSIGIRVSALLKRNCVYLLRQPGFDNLPNAG